jgi:hypothetical protein
MRGLILTPQELQIQAINAGLFQSLGFDAKGAAVKEYPYLGGFSGSERAFFARSRSARRIPLRVSGHLPPDWVFCAWLFGM